MINWESLAPIPFAGGVIVYLYKKLNNKVGRKECERVHNVMDKRLEDMHSDIRIIKEVILKK